MPTQEITQENLDSTLPAKGVAVLDFWAAWCRPCSQFSPVFEHVSEQVTDVFFGSVNTDQQQELAAQFQVQSLPTVIVLVDGLVAYRRAGVMTGRELKALAEQFRALAASRDAS